MPIFPRHRHLPDLATSGHPARAIAVETSDTLVEANVQEALDSLNSRMPRDDEYGVVMSSGGSLEVEPSGSFARQVTGTLTLWVDAVNGNDHWDGLTSQTAFRTLTKAADFLKPLANPRDHQVIIRVKDGDYVDDFPTFRIDGTVLVIVASPASQHEPKPVSLVYATVTQGAVQFVGLNIAAVDVEQIGRVTFDLCDFGIPDHWCSIEAYDGGEVRVTGSCRVLHSDPTYPFIYCSAGGFVHFTGDLTCLGTLAKAPGVPWVLVFANSTVFFEGAIDVSEATVTGKKFDVTGMSNVVLSSYDASTFPLGDTAGTWGLSADVAGTFSTSALTVGTETGLVKRVNGQVMTAAPGDGYVATGVDFLVFYLRQDGSDANDGLANSPDRAFRTFARVKAEAAKYRLNGSHAVDWDLWDEDFPWFAGSPYVLVYFGPGAYAEEWENGNTWLTWDRQDVALELRSTTGLSSEVELYGIQVNDGCSVHVRQITLHSLYSYGNASAGYGDATRGLRILFDGDGCGFQARDGGIMYVYGHVDLIASDPTPDNQFWAPFSAGYGAKCVTYNGCVVNVSGTFKTAQCAGLAYAYATGFVFFRSTTFNIAGGTVLPKQATALNGGVIQSNSHTIATFPGNGAPTIDDLGSSFLGRTRQKELIVPNIIDTNGNEILRTANVASAVNEITVTNAATGNKPQISATGNDTNITLNLVSKGSGTVQANGVDVATLSGTQTLTNKTLSGLKVSSAAAPSSATATGTAGEVRFDANYFYYCVATNTWKRTPLSTW